MGAEQAAQIEKNGNVVVIHLTGDVTATSKAFFDEVYANEDVKGTQKILLKFKPEAYINSGGIALLIQLFAETIKKGKKIGITGVSDHFSKIFKMVGITKFAALYPSQEEGLKQLGA